MDISEANRHLDTYQALDAAHDDPDKFRRRDNPTARDMFVKFRRPT